MINWILSRPEMRRFLARSARKKQAIVLEKQQSLEAKKLELRSQLAEAKKRARQIQLRRERGAEDSEIRNLRSGMQEPIAGVYTIINDYTRSLLWLEVHRTLTIEGFVMPEQLTALRADTDYGLLSLEEFDGIEAILDADNDPFAEIETSVLQEFGLSN